ncbi:MAG: glucose-6-phosphate isomerase [Balneolaceae bacterium]|nr:glucose-6-phosphate isomerase [Balneolaceae bacterium]
MLNVDTSPARSHLDDTALQSAESRVNEAWAQLQSGEGPGAEWLGWRSMLADPNDAELERIDALGGEIREEADVLVVCGIGGSYLGSRALVEALAPRFEAKPEIVYAGRDLDGGYLRELTGWLERPGPEGEPRSVYLNVVSKSGTTLETALAFRVLRAWMEERYPGELARRIICTTGQEGGALNALAREGGYRTLAIPEDVGGRFSVLTPAGLLPAAAAGIDIRTLYYEAVSRYKELEEDPAPAVDYAATRLALHEGGTAVDLLAAFEPRLHGMARWLQQLLGESEGKKGRGLFPAVATYSTDLHSLGQIVQQGRRNLMQTFLRVESMPHTPRVPREDDDLDGLNYTAGRSFHEINRRAFRGTLQAHSEGGVPCITVSLDRLNAQHLGDFIYFYELVTAIYGYALGVNPFTQPGVEDYKKAVYHLLGRE